MARRPLCLIVNPHAGGGRARKRLPAVEDALRARSIRFRVELTESLDHARVLAVLPGGRGNDFARKLGLGSDPVAACDVLALGREQMLDVADINGRAYLGIASSGLDSDAGDLANATRLRAKLGQLVYVYATLRAVRAWRPARWQVVIDGEPRSFSGYSVAVCNSGVFGGGMFLAPDAKLDDGMLEVVTIGDIPKRKYLGSLPKVFNGTHLLEPGVELVQAREVAFHADRPFNVQADGDPIADLPATVRVQPGALRVLVP